MVGSSLFIYIYLLIAASSISSTTSTCFSSNITVYDNSVHSPFSDWSYNTHNLTATSPVHSAPYSISSTLGAYDALYFYCSGCFNTSNVAGLQFWVNGGTTSSPKVNLDLITYSGSTSTVTGPTTDVGSILSGYSSIPAGTWAQGYILIFCFPSGNYDGFWLQSNSGTSQGIIYFDDITLVGPCVSSSSTSSTGASSTTTAKASTSTAAATTSSTSTSTTATTATTSTATTAATSTTATATAATSSSSTTTSSSCNSANTLVVYDNAVESPFSDWSWATNKSATSTTTFHSPPYSYSYTPGASYDALYFECSACINPSLQSGLQFWVNGGATGGQNIQISFIRYVNSSSVVTGPSQVVSTVIGESIPANTLASYPSGTYDGIWVQNGQSTAQSTLYVDDAILLGTGCSTTSSSSSSVSVTAAATSIGTTTSKTTAASTTATSTTATSTTSGSSSSSVSTTSSGSTTGGAKTYSSNAIPMGPCTPGRDTHYDYPTSIGTGTGACAFGTLGGPTLPMIDVAAPVLQMFQNATQCGICYEVTGPIGAVIVMVADSCPVCPTGFDQHMDFGTAATFDQISEESWGIVLTTKRVVACPLTGNVGIRTNTGVSSSWLAFVVFNHRVGLTSVSISWSGSSQIVIPRASSNYWTYSGGSGTVQTPYTVYITGTTGETISFQVNNLNSNAITTSNVQFADPPSGVYPTANCSAPAPNATVYDDELFIALASSSDWANTSFSVASSNFAYAVSPYSGDYCIEITLSSYGGLQLQREIPFTWSGLFTNLTFAAKAATAFSKLTVTVLNSSGTNPTPVSLSLTTTWQRFSILLGPSGLNAPAQIGASNQLQWQNNQGSTSPTLFFDSIIFA